MTATANLVDQRYDFVLLFDVTDGNPNGDPDSGNMPRVDPQTRQGIVTDVCMKRKIRNAMFLLGEATPRLRRFPNPGCRLTRSESSTFSINVPTTHLGSRSRNKTRRRPRPTVIPGPRRITQVRHATGCAKTFSTFAPSARS